LELDPRSVDYCRSGIFFICAMGNLLARVVEGKSDMERW
jgi:hypothetical protein